MESAGAQNGYLSVEGASQLRAEMQPDDDGSRHIVFDASPRAANFPEAIINYVRRSRKTVILADARRETGEFPADDYLRRVKPKSVLVMAIQRQEKLLAVLYLENNLVSGAFTPEHRTVLEVLAAQAAISLETAGVYENLRLNELRFRLGQTAARIGTWEYDLKSTRFWGSDEAKRIYGFDAEDIDFSTEKVEACIPERQRVHQALLDLIGKGVPYDLEFEIRPVDGSAPRFISSIAELYRDSQGTPVKVVGVIQDITERNQAEEEIAWNLAISQALSSLYIPIVTAGTSIEQIADAVLEKSRQLTGSVHGYVAEIDPATGDLIALTNTKMLQTECKIAQNELRKIRFPRRADGLYNASWGHALNTKEPFYDNAPVKHPALVGIPKGHIAIESFLAVPVLLAGELVGQIALSNSSRAYTDRDLDAINRIAEFYALAIQHKRVEEEIRQLNIELEQRVIERTAKLKASNKELEAFAYSVSHDLRAPLRHIDGFMELLEKKAEPVLDDQSRHYMGTISDAAKKMGQLIDDLLSFSRMSRHAMSFQPVDLENMLRDIIRELEPDTAGRHIEWRIGDLPKVEGDAVMLRMALVNLIDNAVKFTRPRQQAQIEIGSISDQDSETVIFIRDNGVGFDMTYADKLFGVFQRLHRADEFEGTGIGLANVRRIITRHGGRFWAEAQVDKGATFYFSLPTKTL
jgi:PAS domain S-box-containing protein